MKEDGIPLSRVFDSSAVTARAAVIPHPISSVSIRAATTDCLMPSADAADEAKNMVIIAIRAENLPLQGTKLFVKIARSLSLGESIILQPITPTTLQPKPMQVVRACFPHAPQHLNALSILYAIRGR